MPAWFDINGLDESSPEDRAGFTEAQARIEKVGRFLRRFWADFGSVGVVCKSGRFKLLSLSLSHAPPPPTYADHRGGGGRRRAR